MNTTVPHTGHYTAQQTTSVPATGSVPAKKAHSWVTISMQCMYIVLAVVALYQVRTYLKITAMHDCAQDYRYTVVEQPVDQTQQPITVSYPIEDSYTACVKSKGF